MNAINKISDLKVGNEYYVFWGSRLYYKVKLLEIINEFPGHTELYFESKHGTNLVYCHEIGIGLTKKEAKDNYARFDYEYSDIFSTHFNDNPA